MAKLLNLVTSLHTSTKRDYLGRMNDRKVESMLVAKKYEEEYWDGDRRYGYGGYKYIPGRWKSVAQELIKLYDLTNKSSILDVGCGKAFLLYEIQQLLPQAKLVGFDISRHGLNSRHPEFKGNLFVHNAEDPFPFSDKEFDLVISLGTFHNLRLPNLINAIQEVERVGKQKYIMVESYRNELELFNLECWALTAEAFFDQSEWIWIYNKFGYTGDYEFIFFE
jgi:SAM-dependent methyltransferase